MEFDFYNMTPYEAITYAYIISVLISENKTADQLNKLGNFLMVVSDNLILIASQIPSSSTDIPSD